jgi:hypothetical protein
VQTLILSLEQLSLGALATVACLALRALPGGFPSLIAHIAAVSWGIAGAAALRLPAGGGREAAPYLFALGVGALLFARLALWERHGLARVLLALLLAGGAAVLIGAARVLGSRLADPLAAPLVGASLLASALVLGSALATMILGHWYLIPPPLPFTHLVRGAVVFLLACGVRALVSLLCIAWFARSADPAAAAAFERLLRVEGDLVFFALRVFWGIAGPLVLSVLVLRTARLHANQSATGLLYVSVVFVLIGELLSNFLLVESSVPL